jgi:hypothetical protein
MDGSGGFPDTFQNRVPGSDIGSDFTSFGALSVGCSFQVMVY